MLDHTPTGTLIEKINSVLQNKKGCTVNIVNGKLYTINSLGFDF